MKQISGNITSEYILYQNYPNPFNPSTTIRYSISRTVFVKLAVYDLMGREVNILVKEKQSAGTYEAVWLATNFPSGVYFYRIKAGDYSETKRLILLK
ncbi:MAG: T9SS type A sorting domain-containing protein [Ignavibacteriae bacterium]|nr:T9SS type A sorting domain-containing protein [Ignavibacteriota bacterium]